ncbi:MAG: hypothetical protein M1460_03445 [Candidatus Thermoplasmatota archaeon]|nr:hypothetical protein [Candidatus Thermoplasmatota archaeon]
MNLNDDEIFEILEEHSVIGSEEYGGNGAPEEFVLVGMIYQHFTLSESSVLRLKREDLEIYRVGTNSYIAWMEDDEDVFMEEDEGNFDYDTTFPEKLPVAIEGPFTDSEILELINGGSI